MAKVWIIAVALAGVLLAGCTQIEPLTPPAPPPVHQGVQLSPLSKPLKAEEADKYFLLVRLNIITVQLPLGAVSDSEELWSYLNEEPINSRNSPLPYNGIRVGVGTEAAWPEVAAVLRRFTGQPLGRSQFMIRPGEPLPVVFKQFQPPQTIFTYRADRTLLGQDYPAGDDVLMTAAAVNLDEPTSVHLAGALVVRSTAVHPRYVTRPGGVDILNQPDYFALPELDFRVKTPPKGFLLIGPGRQVRRPSSPGQQFMVFDRQGLKFENIVVLVPEVFAAPITQN